MANKPTVDFKINIPEPVTFQFNDCKEGEGQYGKWYLYNVENRGEDRAMFVYDEAHAKIQSLMPIQGKTVEITKEQGEGKKFVWKVVESGVEVLSTSEPKKSQEGGKTTLTGQARMQKQVANEVSRNVERHEARKESSMQHLAERRDATLITVAIMGQGSVWDDEHIQKEVKKWVKFFHDEIYDPPFIS